LPLSAYDTVLGDTPERRAISPMFIELLRGTGAADRGPPRSAGAGASRSNRFGKVASISR